MEESVNLQDDDDAAINENGYLNYEWFNITGREVQWTSLNMTLLKPANFVIINGLSNIYLHPTFIVKWLLGTSNFGLLK